MSDLPENNNNGEDIKELLREFEENPFDASKRTAEDVMRVFYQFNVPMVPVMSRRNTLLGVITKDDITSEMSDIARYSSRPVDDFVTKLARKLPLEELLPYLSMANEFVTINIFGEVQGRLSRAELMASCEGKDGVCTETEIDESRERQAFDWMIYTILEYIPRALYAVNTQGKTIFFNGHFEEVYRRAFHEHEVDHEMVERVLADNSLNEYIRRDSNTGCSIYRNSDLGVQYEKVPMLSNGNPMGFLIYFGDPEGLGSVKTVKAGHTLAEYQSLAERECIVDSIHRNHSDLNAAAKELDISRQTLMKKIDQHRIKISDDIQLADKAKRVKKSNNPIRKKK